MMTRLRWGMVVDRGNYGGYSSNDDRGPEENMSHAASETNYAG